MNRNQTLKISGVALGVLLLGTLLAVWIAESKMPFSKVELAAGNGNDATVRFQDVGETVYFRARAWGFTGDHHEIIVATAPITNEHSEYFIDRQLVYLDTTEIYYKKVSPDTLEIFADMHENVPADFSSKIKVEQSIFQTADEARQFAERYKEYGFNKITVYP